MSLPSRPSKPDLVRAVLVVLLAMGFLDLSKFALLYIGEYLHWLRLWWNAL